MERLTRPGVAVDPTAARLMFMDSPAKVQNIHDRLLDLILNGPTLNGVNKDVLRQLLRQLYDGLKQYEDTGLTPERVEALAELAQGPVLFTADELLRMDGQPVWVKEKNKYAVVYVRYGDPFVEFELEAFNARYTDWHYYSFKPFKPRIAPRPLTIGELKKMHGKPVYIVEAPDWGHWELSADAEDYFMGRDVDFYGMKHNDPEGRHGLHMMGWLAYHTEPDAALLGIDEEAGT